MAVLNKLFNFRLFYIEATIKLIDPNSTHITFGFSNLSGYSAQPSELSSILRLGDNSDVFKYGFYVSSIGFRIRNKETNINNTASMITGTQFGANNTILTGSALYITTLSNG